jgi:hypothetical protein
MLTRNVSRSEMSSDNDADGFFAAIGKGAVQAGCVAIAAPLIALPASAYKAMFYLPLWRWFAVPLGAPDMGFWHFIGLLFLWGVLNPQPALNKDCKVGTNEALWLFFVAPALSLMLGAIIHFWLT